MAKSERAARRFFTTHASSYSRSSSFAGGPDLSALLKALAPKKTETALDVGTGTGFTALALAPRVKKAVGVDITEEMLCQARRLAKERGAENVSFRRGNALKLRFPALSFDIVATRRATHHFDSVPAFLREARRVLRPAGRLGIVDMSPPRGAVEFTNGIERLRDSSHVWAYDPLRWRDMLVEAGFSVASESVLGEPISFTDWLQPVRGGGEEEAAIRAAWKEAPARVENLLKADIRRGEIMGWTKHRIIIVASPGTP
jgi:ubiquinone/menaquinone biosynthesis C-methylase UbiE